MLKWYFSFQKLLGSKMNLHSVGHCNSVNSGICSKPWWCQNNNMNNVWYNCVSHSICVMTPSHGFVISLPCFSADASVNVFCAMYSLSSHSLMLVQLINLKHLIHLFPPFYHLNNGGLHYQGRAAENCEISLRVVLMQSLLVAVHFVSVEFVKSRLFILG